MANIGRDFRQFVRESSGNGSFVWVRNEEGNHREDENAIVILGVVVSKHTILKIKKFKLKHLKFSKFKIL